jgi:cytochrome b
MTDATQSDAAPRMIPVWDRVVRVGHWVLVGGFAVAYLTEGEPQWLHTWAGYAVAATVALRIVWGFVGPQRARFSDFVTGPGRALDYLKGLLKGTAPRFVGHSPAGGLMAVALLAALAGTTWTGMMLYAQEENAGPLAPWFGGQTAAIEAPALIASAQADEDGDEYGEHGAGGEGDETLEELHETFANATLALIILHVAGVVVASRAHDENLVRAMIDGRKRA